MRGQSWSAEKILLLRSLWGAGFTAETIGIRIGGRSRSAVLGKIFRLRLDTAAGDNVTSKKAAAHDGPALPPARRRRQRIKPPPNPPAPVTQHKTLLELTNVTCRWPHGRPGAANFFFCGAPEADLEQGIPYCARHMRRAYTPAASFGTARSERRR